MKKSDKKKTSRNKERGSSKSESSKTKSEQPGDEKQKKWRTVPRTKSKSTTSPAKTHASIKTSTQTYKVSKADQSPKVDTGTSGVRLDSPSRSSSRTASQRYRRNLHQELQDLTMEYSRNPYGSRPRTTDKGVSTPFRAVQNVRVGTSDDLSWIPPPPPYSWPLSSITSVTYSASGRSRMVGTQDCIRSNTSIRCPIDEFRRRDETFSSINEDEVWTPPLSESILTVSSEPPRNHSKPLLEEKVEAVHQKKIKTTRALSLPTMVRLTDQHFPEILGYPGGNSVGSRSWWSSGKILALGLACGFLYMAAMSLLALKVMMSSDEDGSGQAVEKTSNFEQPSSGGQGVPSRSQHNQSTQNDTITVPS